MQVTTHWRRPGELDRRTHHDRFQRDQQLHVSLRPTSVPEPGTVALMAFGIAAVALSRRRRKA
jgi:hypothetical protein